MTTVKDIALAMEALAPVSMAEPTDNVGLLYGDNCAGVTRALIALDITTRVIEEADSYGAQIIIVHHPLFWDVNRITDGSAIGRRLLMLGAKGIAAVCMHTNLDSVEGGINTILADMAGLTSERFFVREGGKDAQNRPYGLGIYGYLPEKRQLLDFIIEMNGKLGCKSVRYLDAGKPIHKLAVGSGKCTLIFEEVLALGCDTFLTGDIKHYYWLDAQDMGVNLIDMGHFPTENIMCEPVMNYLAPKFPEVEFMISKRHDEPFSVL